MAYAPPQYEEMPDRVPKGEFLIQHVEGCSQRIGEPTSQKEDHGKRWDALRERTQDREDGPAHGQIQEGGDQLEASGEERILDNSRHCQPPNDSEDSPPGGAA